VGSVTIEAIGGGWYLVADDSRRWRVAVARDADRHWVFVDGEVAILPTANRHSGPRAKAKSEDGVMAPMPATVVAVNVAAGQSVKHGETLIVLEAMKMELPIRAPHDGVVKAVHCVKGELVQPGVNLLEFV
jgi:3-methylcrotonyl-CoA carboxylase alpha subunit